MLPVTIAQAVDKVYDFDVNADGILSPLDSLIVINHINRESGLLAANASITSNASNAKLDVNLDGMISLLDALILINRINQKPSTAMMNTMESNDIAKKRSQSDAVFMESSLDNGVASAM